MVAQLGGGRMPSKASGQRPNRKLLGTFSAPVLAVSQLVLFTVFNIDQTLHCSVRQISHVTKLSRRDHGNSKE